MKKSRIIKNQDFSPNTTTWISVSGVHLFIIVVILQIRCVFLQSMHSPSVAYLIPNKAILISSFTDSEVSLLLHFSNICLANLPPILPKAQAA